MWMGNIFSHRARCALALLVALSMTEAPALVEARSDADAPPTTPTGVSLVEVVRLLLASQPQYLWTRPGDANGRTLFYFDQSKDGSSKCDDVCKKEFAPFIAASGARTTRDWTLVSAKGGGKQWAYQSRLLYTWSKEQRPGQVAQNVALAEAANAKLAESALDRGEEGKLLPPDGWQVARFTPAITMELPDGIDARLVSAAERVILTDQSGLTLYTFSGKVEQDGQRCATGGCEIRWMPLAAPELANNVGDFSIVTREDGTTQWAYRKRPLYTFRNDKVEGDVSGLGVDKRWEVATVTENFHPKSVALRQAAGYGPVFTAGGSTLYAAYPFQRRWGGRDLRDNFHNAYFEGKEFKDTGCLDAQCLKSWRPFIADADAKPSGFWEVIKRRDGAYQWAYKGFAVYTYSEDRKPGDVNGNAIYDYAIGEGRDQEQDLTKVTFLAKFQTFTRGGAGVYWHVTKP
jgi:predicted lipoprotein with Yx(FWY)xxD motif